MNPLSESNYQLDIYTPTSCYRGEFSQANSRRISDILNDRSHSFLTLENARLIFWDDGTPQEGEPIGTITIVKRNVIALVVANGAQTGGNGSHVYRVDKTPKRVALYTPSLEVIGNLHLSPGAELLIILDSTHIDFLPLTSTAMRWLDRRAPLPNSTGLMFINRNLISGIRTIFEPGSPSEMIDPANLVIQSPRMADVPA